jgi:hypothetical protein
MLYIALRVAACFSSLALSLLSVILPFIRIVVVSICAKNICRADCPFIPVYIRLRFRLSVFVDIYRLNKMLPNISKIIRKQTDSSQKY